MLRANCVSAEQAIPVPRSPRTPLTNGSGRYPPELSVSSQAAAPPRPCLTGDAVQRYRLRANHQPAIAFCTSVAHAEHVAEAFRAAGYRAVSVAGTTPHEQRDAAIAGLGDGAVGVLCTCDLICEGADVPTVAGLILLRPTKSLTLFLQQLGRGMRIAPGKKWLIVNDHVGNVLEHGLPDAHHEWSLNGLPKRPVRLSAAQGWRCDCGCLNAWAALICGGCGGTRRLPKRSPRSVDGELVEATAERFEAVRRMSYRDMLRTNLSFAELQEFGRANGYKPGWARHRFREQTPLQTPLPGLMEAASGWEAGR